MHEEAKVVHADIPSPPRALPIEEEIKAHAEGKEIVRNEVVMAPGRWSMTRRFTVAEKLKIIEKYKETENASATCRQVIDEFRRRTFDRKSLRTMVANEMNLRGALGTKRVRKTVRARTGQFPKMDTELAK